MYQFTTEHIINSNVSDEGLTRFWGDSAGFHVLRGGNFKKANVVSVFKSPYVPPVYESLVTTLTTTPVSGTVYRLEVNLRLVGSMTSDYANEYVIKSKSLYFEVAGSSTVNSATTLATAFKNAVNKEAIVFGNGYLTASSSGAALTLTAVNEYQRFTLAQVQSNVSSSTTPMTFSTVEQDLLTTGSLTAGTEGFGTVKQIVKNLRLPTVENTNWLALTQDERPVAGGQYTQYSIRMQADRGVMGTSVVGSQVTSITDHIFYVLSTQTTAFESALTTAGLTIINAINKTGAFTVSCSDTTIAVGDNTTVVAAGAVGTVTFASGTAGVATVNSTTGVVTAVSAGTSVITATDTYTGGTQTATITITVIA